MSRGQGEEDPLAQHPRSSRLAERIARRDKTLIKHRPALVQGLGEFLDRDDFHGYGIQWIQAIS